VSVEVVPPLDEEPAEESPDTFSTALTAAVLAVVETEAEDLVVPVKLQLSSMLEIVKVFPANWSERLEKVNFKINLPAPKQFSKPHPILQVCLP